MNDETTPTTDPATPVVPQVPAPAAAPAADTERIGRFSRADLEAMRGKRGRKPAEFYQLFPATDTPAKPASAPAARKARLGTPRVSSALLGDDTIDELLARAGAKGSKPAAYHILVAAAEHLIAAGAVEAPISDPLARRVADAPAKVRRLVEALLDAAE